MDLYTSIASIIAFVVVAIIIRLIEPRPPEATVGLKDRRARPPGSIRFDAQSSAQTPTRRGRKRWFHIDPCPSGGFLHGHLQNPGKASIVVVRPPSALKARRHTH
jgi:hypothetical protein